jgi:hypothetical protein
MERIYNLFLYENPGFRPKDIANKTYGESAGLLFARLATLQSQLRSLNEKDWCDLFLNKCEAEETKERATWEAEWLNLCDGKRFFLDLHSHFDLKISPQKFKKLIIERMEKEQSEGWVVVEKLIADAIRV